MGGTKSRSSRIPRESETATALSNTIWKGHGVNARPDPPPRIVSRQSAASSPRRSCAAKGPSRIVTRATRLGLSPVLTRAVVVACAASALDSDGIVARQRPAE